MSYRKLCCSEAVLIVAVMCTVADAQPPGGGRGGARGRAQQENPKTMSEQMLANHDKDGDKKLNAEELTAAMTAMFPQRQQAGAIAQGRGGPVAGGPVAGGPGRRNPGAGGPRGGGIGGNSGSGPGGSPKLQMSDLIALVDRLKDFDRNNDGKLSKDELPDLYAPLFELADANGDGLIDSREVSQSAEDGIKQPDSGNRRQRPQQ